MLPIYTYFGFVQEEWRLQLEVELLGDWLHEVRVDLLFRMRKPNCGSQFLSYTKSVPSVSVFSHSSDANLKYKPPINPRSFILPNLRDSLVKGDLRRRSDDPLDVWVDALQGAEVHLILNRHISISMRNSVPSNIFNH